jgi:hypothetical protein
MVEVDVGDENQADLPGGNAVSPDCPCEDFSAATGAGIDQQVSRGAR